MDEYMSVCFDITFLINWSVASCRSCGTHSTVSSHYLVDPPG